MTSPFSPWVQRYWRRRVVVVEVGGATLLGVVILILGGLGFWPA